jgi:hypothetical protein
VAGSRGFFHLDLFYEHLPVWDATQKALIAGDSHFWIDGEYCGHPLLFHQEAPLLYPATVPMLATGAPVWRLADLFSLFHLGLAGFAAFVLLRDLTRDPGAAFFGGTAWMLSARMVQSVLWPNAVAVSAWLPLIIWAVLRIGREGGPASRVAVLMRPALLAARPHVLSPRARSWRRGDRRNPRPCSVAGRFSTSPGAFPLALGALPWRLRSPSTPRPRGREA